MSTGFSIAPPGVEPIDGESIDLGGGCTSIGWSAIEPIDVALGKRGVQALDGMDVIDAACALVDAIDHMTHGALLFVDANRRDTIARAVTIAAAVIAECVRAEPGSTMSIG